MGSNHVDREGYRPNVGIILVNGRNEVFWGKRIREHRQFPQGVITWRVARTGDVPELQEEIGLSNMSDSGRTRDRLRYEVPKQWIRRECATPIAQK